jgi:hypothetical protein
MRVRPFFWLLLFCVCVGVTLFSAAYVPHTPAILQVHLQQQMLVTSQPAQIELKLTDTQGLPINDAQISYKARMANMEHSDGGSQLRRLANGQYELQIYLYMAGPWAITIATQAQGFTPQNQTLYVQVE